MVQPPIGPQSSISKETVKPGANTQKNVLLLCLHRPGRSPSQRYRIEQYIPFLEQHGYRFTFSYLLDEKDDQVYYRPGHYFQKLWIVLKSTWLRTKQLFTIRKYDLVFVQREGYMLGTAFFEKRMARNLPMIFDFDDAIWIPVVSEGNKNLAFLKNAAKTNELIAAAALVFAGNAFLAAHARQFNHRVAIVPTTVHIARQMPLPPKDNAPVCIGWSGSFSTVEHFRLLLPVLKRIKQTYGGRVRFQLMGDGNYHDEELDIRGLAWSAGIESQVLQSFDIGIMPLPDDEWSKGKCGFKGLLYMSYGIPAVMSPVGVNNEIVRHGVNGFLPATADDWYHCLSQLIEDADLRKKIGEQGLQTVREKYAVEAWEQKYLELFDKTLQQRATKSAIN